MTTADRFYIQQQVMDRETGRCLGIEPIACHEAETLWARDSRLHAQIAWCRFLNEHPICAISSLHPVTPTPPEPKS